MKKLLLAVFAAAALATGASQAQTPAPAAPAAAVDMATDKAIRELLIAIKYREQLSAAFAQVKANAPQMILQMATNAVNANTSYDPAQRKIALDKATKNVPEAVAGVNAIISDPKVIDEMITEIVPLYARHFTLAEIKAMTAFYKTPAGAKMLVTMPRVHAEAKVATEKAVLPRLQKHVEALTNAK
jgi:hypothetical protein